MSTNDIALAAGLAVGVFWVVGAYNRLVGLRNGIAQAWPGVEEQIRRRQEVLPQLAAALRERLRGGWHVLDAVLAAQLQVQAASDALRARPVNATAAGTLATAENVSTTALGRLLALLDGQAELREDADVGTWLSELRDADQRLALARQQFNERVDAYNAAARQFPTNIVARLFGLGLGGRF